jgi:hypothetical protein
MAEYKDTRELVTFDCPKLGAVAHLSFDTREHFLDESDAPIVRNLIRHDCDGRLSCGITPRVSPTMWGTSDWKSCEYPHLNSKGVR